MLGLRNGIPRVMKCIYDLISSRTAKTIIKSYINEKLLKLIINSNHKRNFCSSDRKYID